jgi:hypothetical protein
MAANPTTIELSEDPVQSDLGMIYAVHSWKDCVVQRL